MGQAHSTAGRGSIPARGSPFRSRPAFGKQNWWDDTRALPNQYHQSRAAGDDSAGHDDAACMMMPGMVYQRLPSAGASPQYLMVKNVGPATQQAQQHHGILCCILGTLFIIASRHHLLHPRPSLQGRKDERRTTSSGGRYYSQNGTNPGTNRGWKGSRAAGTARRKYLAASGPTTTLIHSAGRNPMALVLSENDIKLTSRTENFNNQNQPHQPSRRSPTPGHRCRKPPRRLASRHDPYSQSRFFCTSPGAVRRNKNTGSS